MFGETKNDLMERFMLLAIIIGVIAAVAMSINVKNGYRRGIAGIGEPVQGPAEGFIHQKIGDYDLSITFINSYDIEGLVVHTRNYTTNNIGDQLSPCDIGLAWGIVAENNDKIDFKWSHGNRFLNLFYDPEIEKQLDGRSNIDRHISNNHVIPADMSIFWQLRSIHTGDHVRLKGYLVNVEVITRNGQSFFWYSSLTREDVGDGACEVMYVTSVEWL